MYDIVREFSLVAMDDTDWKSQFSFVGIKKIGYSNMERGNPI